jgi:drug/metabolite transporter (DMT)-like permease
MVLFAINNVAVAAMALSALTTALYRLWIGTVALAVILWLTGRTPDRAVLRAAIPGGIAYAAGVCLMFSAFQTTSLANATIILALQSGLTLTVVGRFFGETVRPGDLVLTAVATLGVVLIVVGGEGGGAGDLKGDAFAALGMVATTAYFVLAKQARVDVPAAEYQLGLLLVAAVATVPAFMLLGEPLTAPTTWDWARLALLAGGGSVGHLGLNWAHRHVPLKATSLLTLAVPVISPALAWVVLDERLSALQSAGAAVTLGTLAAVIVRSVRPPVELPRGAPAH